VNTLALIAKKGKPETLTLARELVRRFPQKKVLVEPDLAEALGWPLPSLQELVGQAELAIVLGGDGTLIHAARVFRGRNVPLLGVNLGSLGFMTEVRQEDFFEVISEVLAGRFNVDSRMKLCCRLWRGKDLILEDEVLNDVVINKGALARIAAHETTIDSEYVTTYYSDGVIVATPTGSTAYSLSAGGPIVHPALDSVIVSPICSHALTPRSIVVPPDRTIQVTLKSETADVYLTLDGQAGHPLRTEDRVEVQRSPNRAFLVRNPRMGYFAILRQKLHWGER
jgi:NAD+ kinase